MMDWAGPPHHILTRGSVGPIDMPWNLLSLCTMCHTAVGYGVDHLLEINPDLCGVFANAEKRKLHMGETKELIARAELLLESTSTSVDEAKTIIFLMLDRIIDLENDIADLQQLIAQSP